jgi:hypothetical protein
MEAQGALVIFQEIQRDMDSAVCELCGHGVLEGSMKVNKAEVYGAPVEVMKLEHVGHSKKKITSRLMK